MHVKVYKNVENVKNVVTKARRQNPGVRGQQLGKISGASTKSPDNHQKLKFPSLQTPLEHDVRHLHYKLQTL